MLKRGKYLLTAWGGDSAAAAEAFTPDLEHGGALHWWSYDEEELDALAKRLHKEFKALATAKHGPRDNDGNENDVTKRTVALVNIKLPSGEVRRIEYDFGYGYPESSARYMFEDGNYACDCNRSAFLGIEDMKCGHVLEMVAFGVELRD